MEFDYLFSTKVVSVEEKDGFNVCRNKAKVDLANFNNIKAVWLVSWISYHVASIVTEFIIIPVDCYKFLMSFNRNSSDSKSLQHSRILLSILVDLGSTVV